MDFFDVNAGHPALPRFRLVDVPGLGFARVSKDLRQRWVSLIGGYFVQRRSLKLVFHLLDAGLCEIMPADRELWQLLAQAQRNDYELCICLTKADGSTPSQIERFAKIVREALRQEGSELALRATIFACSSRSKLGKDTLWRKIWSAVGGEGSYADLDAPGAWREQEEEDEEEEEGWDEVPDDEDDEYDGEGEDDVKRWAPPDADEGEGGGRRRRRLARAGAPAMEVAGGNIRGTSYML